MTQVSRQGVGTSEHSVIGEDKFIVVCDCEVSYEDGRCVCLSAQAGGRFAGRRGPLPRREQCAVRKCGFYTVQGNVSHWEKLGCIFPLCEIDKGNV